MANDTNKTPAPLHASTRLSRAPARTDPFCTDTMHCARRNFMKRICAHTAPFYIALAHGLEIERLRVARTPTMKKRQAAPLLPALQLPLPLRLLLFIWFQEATSRGLQKPIRTPHSDTWLMRISHADTIFGKCLIRIRMRKSFGNSFRKMARMRISFGNSFQKIDRNSNMIRISYDPAENLMAQSSRMGWAQSSNRAFLNPNKKSKSETGDAPPG